MFARLVQKELLHHLLDFRFVTVFALCALLSGLSVYIGGRNYVRQVQEYRAVAEDNRRNFQESSLDKGRLFDLVWVGYSWNRRPEALNPVVYGLSGTVGREVLIRYQWPTIFEASVFETDPIHALFGVLDLAFIVKVVLSLCVLLFTYDAVCGEKEGGTLRLYASFPVSRSMLALAKLAGSTVAVLVPFVFAGLLAAVVLALSPDVGLRGEDWERMGVLMGVFALYLAVFAAFGLWVSALTHRRMTAFLGLLGLWTVWIFVVPNLAVDLAQRFVPVKSVYDLQKRDITARWQTRKEASDELGVYFERTRVEDWNALSEAERERIQAGRREETYRVTSRWDGEYQSRVEDARMERRNQMRSRRRLAMGLSMGSPFGAVSYVSTDLGRVGFVQQERVEDALSAYLIYLTEYIHEKRRKHVGSMFQSVDMADFTWFTYRDKEALGECLVRNAFHILNLALLALLGFAGAYVAILRYDVR